VDVSAPTEPWTRNPAGKGGWSVSTHRVRVWVWNEPLRGSESHFGRAPSRKSPSQGKRGLSATRQQCRGVTTALGVAGTHTLSLPPFVTAGLEGHEGAGFRAQSRAFGVWDGRRERSRLLVVRSTLRRGRLTDSRGKQSDRLARSVTTGQPDRVCFHRTPDQSVRSGFWRNHRA